MSIKTNLKKPAYSFLPTDIEGFDSFAELTLDTRWSWDHAAHKLEWMLDSTLCDFTHNLWVVLHTVSGVQFQFLMNDPAFQNTIVTFVKSKKDTKHQ